MFHSTNYISAIDGKAHDIYTAALSYNRDLNVLCWGVSLVVVVVSSPHQSPRCGV